MYSRFVLLVICLAFDVVQGEVKLTKGRNETITFEGNELTIDVDNSLGANAELTLCFGSSPDESRQPCPLGYARFSQGIGGNHKVRFIINRQGRFVGDKSWLVMLGNVKFNGDGTLNIMVVQLPDARTTVTLPNAEIFVPEKQLHVIVQKRRSNVGTVGILAIIIVLIVVGAIVGIFVWCCITRTSKPKQTPELNHQDDSPPSQQFRHPKILTPRKPSSKHSIKRASNTTTTTVHTTVSPKRVRHPSPATNNKSPTMEKSRNVTTPFAANARILLPDTNNTSINNIDNSMSEASQHRLRV
uniref:Uncharacterized protein n=1 Tax=Panagrellus redivivus TaxID=6233 RepID=A0A7E4ZV25_PANRE